jgi:TRAP-type C4-dicarboxylate transport system substrate-binding protein
MIGSMRRLARPAAAALLPLLVVACASGGAAPAARTDPAPSSPGAAVAAAAAVPSPAADALTIRLATPEAQGAPSQPFLDLFASEVAKRSGGSLAIDIRYHADGGDPTDTENETKVGRQVMSGQVEMAVVPVRAWGDLGVSSLQALQAPFLIDTDALLTAVASDSALIQPLLDGMAPQGLVGLAAWPEDLRHLFSFPNRREPALSPKDLAGQQIWVLKSAAQAAVMQALGATPAGVRIPDALVADGKLQVAESGMWAGALNLPGPPTATADVTFYPKFVVMVAEDAAWARLSADQQAVVKAAAIAARDLAIREHRSDADLARAYCAQGGTVVLAGAGRVAEFVAAMQPVYDQLEKDPLTATALKAIRALKASTAPSDPTTACRPPVSATATIPPVTPGDPIGFVPDGTYVQPSLSPADLMARGVDERNAVNNQGAITMTFKGSTASFFLKKPDGEIEPTCTATFKNLGDRIRMEFDNVCGPHWLEFRWKLDGDQLKMTFVDDESGQLSEVIAYDGIWGGPWTKVE